MIFYRDIRANVKIIGQYRRLIAPMIVVQSYYIHCVRLTDKFASVKPLFRMNTMRADRSRKNMYMWNTFYILNIISFYVYMHARSIRLGHFIRLFVHSLYTMYNCTRNVTSESIALMQVGWYILLFVKQKYIHFSFSSLLHTIQI